MKPLRQITSAERTNMWTVCLTSQGVLGYLNRRVSPLGGFPHPSRTIPLSKTSVLVHLHRLPQTHLRSPWHA